MNINKPAFKINYYYEETPNIIYNTTTSSIWNKIHYYLCTKTSIDNNRSRIRQHIKDQLIEDIK